MNNKGRSIGELQMMEGQSDLPNCIKIQLYSLKSDFPIKITLKLSSLKVVPVTEEFNFNNKTEWENSVINFKGWLIEQNSSSINCTTQIELPHIDK